MNTSIQRSTPGIQTHSPLRNVDLTVPAISPHSSTIPHLNAGYVANWTASKSACTYPHLHNIHGSYINPKQGSIVNYSTSQACETLPIVTQHARSFLSSVPQNCKASMPRSVYLRLCTGVPVTALKTPSSDGGNIIVPSGEEARAVTGTMRALGHASIGCASRAS